mgnify:CR=1 FL=1
MKMMKFQSLNSSDRALWKRKEKKKVNHQFGAVYFGSGPKWTIITELFMEGLWAKKIAMGADYDASQAWSKSPSSSS